MRSLHFKNRLVEPERELTDQELDHVSGGTTGTGTPEPAPAPKPKPKPKPKDVDGFDYNNFDGGDDFAGPTLPEDPN